MNDFDSTIILFLNQFAKVSLKFDLTIRLISESTLLKGAVFMALLWWAWFNEAENNKIVRKYVISIQLGCLIAITFGRTLSLTLPYRSRPIHEEGLDFLYPHGIFSKLLKGWSSFPSDHAVLFFALATGLMFISKKIGVFALIYSLLIIGLPRVYLGLHYPTDILVGAVIGIGIGWLATKTFASSKYCGFILNWSVTRPYYFYPLFFIITFQISENLNSAKYIISKFYKIFFVM